MPLLSGWRADSLPKSVNHMPPLRSNTRSFGPRSGCSPQRSYSRSTLPVRRSTRSLRPPPRGGVGRRPGGDRDPGALDVGEPAVVAHVHRAVGPDRRAVRPAAQVRDDLRLAVPAPRQRPALDLDDDHRAILHRDRPLGKPEPLGDDLDAPRALDTHDTTRVSPRANASRSDGNAVLLSTLTCVPSVILRGAKPYVLRQVRDRCAESTKPTSCAMWVSRAPTAIRAAARIALIHSW